MQTVSKTIYKGYKWYGIFENKSMKLNRELKESARVMKNYSNFINEIRKKRKEK